MTTLGYDALDHLISMTDPLNEKQSFSYDSRGWKLSHTDPIGNGTSFQYDGNGNLVSRTDPAPGGTTTYNYDGEDRLVQVIDPLRHSVSYGRDAAERLTSVTDGRGKTLSLQPDGLGRPLRIFDAYSNRIAENYYDSRELLEESTDGMGRVNNWDYDQCGSPVQFTDALASVSAFAYDALRRPIQATSPLSDVTNQRFDQDGNRNSLTNAFANTIVFSFDLSGRLSAVTTASNLTTAYTYNSRDLAETITKPSGQQATYTYDNVLRRSQITDSVATMVYQYDQNGRVVETDDTAYGQVRHTSRTYDNLGRLTSYTDESGNSIGYAYDQAGNLTQLNYPGGKSVAYTYDANNRIRTVTDWALRTTTYTYDDNERLVSTTFPNGTVEGRTYDLSGMLTSIAVTDSGNNSLYSYANQFDATGRIIAETTNPPVANVPLQATTMTCDQDNRLTAWNGQIVNYDTDGNMTLGPANTGSGLLSYSYDAKSRLCSHNGLTYYYSPDGKRTLIQDMVNDSRFVIDPNGLLDRVLVRTTANTQTYYVYGLGLIGQEQNGVYQQYHFDPRGSTVALTDTNGRVIDQYWYGPYGERLGHTGNADTPFQFNGRYGVQTDSNGLLYMRSRYYNPAIRRFINQDVLFGSIDPGISLNRFAFADGNPISLMDPFGLCASEDNYVFGTGVVGALNRITWSINPFNPDNVSALSYRKVATVLSSVDIWYQRTTGGPPLALLGIEIPMSLPMLSTDAAAVAAETTVASETTDVLSVDPNKLNHIFGNAGHNLDSFVAQFNSQSEAYAALQRATELAVRAQGTSGVFQTTVQIGGESITVRANVVSGVVRIGTAFKQ